MKHIIILLLLASSPFAQNTTYIDGTDCGCDSITTSYEYIDIGLIDETAYFGTIMKKIYYDEYKHISSIEVYEINSETQLEKFEYRRTKIGKYRYEYVMTSYHSAFGNDTNWYVSGQISDVYEKQNQTYNCDNWLVNKITSYHENGKIKLKRSSLSQKCIQTDSFYDITGKLKGVTTYKKGKFLSNKCTDGRFGNQALDCSEN